MTIQLNTSWLHGKYPDINAEINTNIPYVAIGEYFWQGDDAEQIIQEIHLLWTKNDCTVEDAIEQYALLLP